MQHKIIRNPFPCILSGDGITNSRGLPPSLGIFDANPDLLTCFTIDQPAGVDDRKGFSTLHQPILHHPLVFVGDLQQDVIQWHHGIRDVATELRHACRAAYDNVRLSGHPAASQLGEGFQESGHAFAADLAVVYRQFGQDEFSADGGDDFIDELPVLGHEALGDGSGIVRIALHDLKVWVSLGREYSGELGWVTAEGDASVTFGKGVLER